ncbi:hypothetical protein [Neomegalonema sp.]|uniref:hypothetical protein n=1 Tax=Neomegalonema sp. TaxID=2039713 RepID=UPI00260B6D32|nr:hypothetical protein [Neomegalonema sp.]MDD2868250.1 hypothetical protein [Neomegalonema sp.]
MGKYAILIHGRGFHVPIEGQAEKSRGFYVTAFLEAENEEEACEMALQALVEDADFHEEIGAHADPEDAELDVESCEELASFEDAPLPRGGFVFYAEEEGPPS